ERTVSLSGAIPDMANAELLSASPPAAAINANVVLNSDLIVVPPKRVKLRATGKDIHVRSRAGPMPHAGTHRKTGDRIEADASLGSPNPAGSHMPRAGLPRTAVSAAAHAAHCLHY